MRVKGVPKGNNDERNDRHGNDETNDIMSNVAGAGKRASKSKKRRAGLPDEEALSDEDDDEDDDARGSSRPPALYCSSLSPCPVSYSLGL